MSEASQSARGTFLAEVLANERLCDEHYRLILDFERFPPTEAGQFIQLLCRPPAEQDSLSVVDWQEGTPPQFTQPELTDQETMLRRPLSLAGRRDHAGGRTELDVIYRKVGTGTRWLSGVKPGDPLSVLGPLGNAFPISQDKPAAVLVGGGVGIPPMLYLAEALRNAGKSSVAFSGARSASLLPLRLSPSVPVSPEGAPGLCVAEFAAVDTPSVVTTDDGSLGFGGLITQPLVRWLESGGVEPGQVVVYSCGPEPMMRAVGELCLSRGIECWLSLERHMACGMGTCQSCVCKLREDNDRGWAYRLCCTDGPVFAAAEVVWD
ncbi:MAG: dihydroorotate dehydrogenase electron transfer subunit [Phycisphaerae bacterium]